MGERRARRTPIFGIFWNFPAGFFFPYNTVGRLFKRLGGLKKATETPKTTNTPTEKGLLRPQTDFIRLVSSKLMLRGASRRPGRPC